MKRTRGSETSQYPEEKKSKEIPSVAASERGRAQTDPNTNSFSCRDRFETCLYKGRMVETICVRVGVVGPRK